MKGISREVDGYTHLALSVMYALYDKGWGKDYPHEIAEIMQKILDLDRKAYKAEREDKA
jgi:hypothetical protein